MGAADATLPRVTVVILAYKRLERLRETLTHTLEDLHYPREQLELIVVDNASENGTPEMLAAEFPDVRVMVHPTNLGTSGWNAGLLAGTGKWTLMLDDDGHLEGDTLKTAIAAAEEHQADLVSFRSRSGYDRDFYFDTDLPTGVLSFWGTAALLSRRAIDTTGGFDPNIFIWGNELELTMRILDAGLRHLHLPDHDAIHMKALPVHGEPLPAKIRHQPAQPRLCDGQVAAVAASAPGARQPLRARLVRRLRTRHGSPHGAARSGAGHGRRPARAPTAAAGALCPLPSQLS